jgi:hypothetical protein
VGAAFLARAVAWWLREIVANVIGEGGGGLFAFVLMGAMVGLFAFVLMGVVVGLFAFVLMGVVVGLFAFVLMGVVVGLWGLTEF